VVLAGAGKAFCAGYDLTGSPYITAPEEGWTQNSAVARLGEVEAFYRSIWDCPKVTIAQVHGSALAAGCYLQLLCDISIAAENARIGHPVRAGGVTSMPLWQVAMPYRKARYLLMTRRVIDGATAERFDLVTMAVPEAELAETVDAVAQDCLATDPNSSSMAKETLNTALEIGGLGAMFRYHGQMNGLARVRRPGAPPLVAPPVADSQRAASKAPA
jgi:enoyl-CoA hydratase